MEANGKTRYRGLLNMKISGKAIEGLEKENFRGPACKRKNRQPDEAYYYHRHTSGANVKSYLKSDRR